MREYTLRDLNGYHLRFGGPETTLDLGLWTLGFVLYRLTAHAINFSV